MATYAEQIGAFESKRAANLAAMDEIMSKAADEGATLDAADQEEFDNLHADNQAIDSHLKRLRTLEDTNKAAAVPANGSGSQQASESRGGTVVHARVKQKLAPGIAFARLAKVRAVSRLESEPMLSVAKKMYGTDSETVATIQKADEVVAGTTISGNWASNLVGDETSAFSDFAEWLRPQTIVGRFGTDGIPPLRMVPFREPLISQTGGGAAYWVGEGKPKPLTAFNFARTTLEPLKVANIAVLTEENIRSSNPSSEMIVRDALRDAIVEEIDLAFIDPANSGSSGVKPASITEGAASIVAETWTDGDDVRLDIRSLFQKFIDANNAPSQGVWIMSSMNALSLEMMVNPLGQPEFSGISMTGGTFRGRPVIVSDHVGDIVVLVNASDIYLGDEGGVSVDMSREASLEMKDANLSSDATSGVGASMVSMFQTNSVALRAERTISWKLRRDSAVAYLTGVAWGGPVNAS